MKLEIIETDDYILGVSDEKIKDGDFCYHTGRNIFYLFEKKVGWAKEFDALVKPIAHQPKGNAPELDLPLLPEIVVEDDDEIIAWENAVNLFLKLENREANLADDRDLLVVGAMHETYKAATKGYSEEDLRKAIDFAIKYTDKGLTTDIVSEILGIDCSGNLEETTQLFIQSLKQPKTPKWFVAEIEEVCRLMSADIVEKENWTKVENSKSTYQRLKTTTINGKTYLVGSYLYE
jgi:hypothetical protein